MTGRGIPFHCPYCGDEDLWPHDPGTGDSAPHGAWECRSCLRAFSLTMLGMARPTAVADTTASSASSPRPGPDGGGRA